MQHRKHKPLADYICAHAKKTQRSANSEEPTDFMEQKNTPVPVKLTYSGDRSRKKDKNVLSTMHLIFDFCFKR